MADKDTTPTAKKAAPKAKAAPKVEATPKAAAPAKAAPPARAAAPKKAAAPITNQAAPVEAAPATPTSAAVTTDDIRRRAHEIFLARAAQGTAGTPVGDWLQAERELNGA